MVGIELPPPVSMPTPRLLSIRQSKKLGLESTSVIAGWKLKPV